MTSPTIKFRHGRQNTDKPKTQAASAAPINPPPQQRRESAHDMSFTLAIQKASSEEELLQDVDAELAELPQEAVRITKPG